MRRIFPRSVLLLIASGLLVLSACTNQPPTATTVNQPTEQANPAPTATPSVLLPSPSTNPVVVQSNPAMTPTPASMATRGAILPTPFGTLAAGSPATSVPILMYHQIKDLPSTASADDLLWTVSPAALDAQLGYLAEKGYVTISLDQLLDGFAGKSPLPLKAVVLTFDDGWKTQYTNALPLLKKRGQTATFYVVSSYMGYGAYFDWNMTEEVKHAGMTIGSHTIEHAALTKLSAAELDRQLRESKVALEKKLNVAVTHFAYPYGAYNDNVIAALKRNGYRSATTLNPTTVKHPVSPFLLPRLRVSYKETLADFAKKLP